MKTNLTREQALALLRKYNQEPFHLLHALTVEGVMEWYAKELGYGEEAHFWSLAGLLVTARIRAVSSSMAKGFTR